jgi:glycosyl transferase family 87
MLSRKNSALVVSVLLAAGMVGYYFRIFLPRVRTTRAARNITFFYGEDLYPYWSATRELFARNTSPYSDQATREIQVAVYGRPLDPLNPFERDQHRFSYPLYVAFLMAPVAWLPFSFVRLCAAIALPVFALLGIILWERAFHLNVSFMQLAIVGMLTLSSYSLLNALFAQQLSLAVFLALSASVWCLSKQRFVSAGIFLALSTIKPQLVVLSVVFLLLWAASRRHKRKSLLTGFLLTQSLFLGASIYLLPTWPQQWLHTIIAYRHYTVPPLAPFIVGRITGTILSCVLLLISVWLWFKARRSEIGSQDFALALSFTLLTTVVTIPTGDSVYDHIFIIPGLLLLIAHVREIVGQIRVARVLLLITTAVFAWQWTSGTLVFVVDLIWRGLIRSPSILSAPLRTQPSMPFALLALLGLRVFHYFGQSQRPLPNDTSLHCSNSNFAK